MNFLKPIILLAVLLIISGCGGLSPKVKKEDLKTDTSLPVITLTKHGIITDMTSIAFEWKDLNDNRVQEIYVYKEVTNQEGKKELQFYTALPSRFKTHFVDMDVKPDTVYAYAFEVVSKDAKGKLSRVFRVNTKPVLQSVTWIYSVNGLPRSAKILWRPHVSERVQKYIIERKGMEEKSFSEVATLNGRLNAEYIDTDLKDNYVYRYRIRVKTYDGIISTPSEIVKTVTKPLPASVTNIKATNNLPKEIKIQWDGKKPKDFYRYHLYRSDKIDGRYELIAVLHNNHFANKVDEDGKVYFYRVSIVDADGLESKHDKPSVMGMTLAKPIAPSVAQPKLVNNAIVLQWSKTDPRTKKYMIERVQKKGWFDSFTKIYKDITATTFKDTDIEPNSTYTYKVYSIDGNGLVSEASTPVSIQVTELVGVSNTQKQQTDTKRDSVQKELKQKSQPKPKEKSKEQNTPAQVVVPDEDITMDEL